jgi:hypothetical protein
MTTTNWDYKLDSHVVDSGNWQTVTRISFKHPEA